MTNITLCEGCKGPEVNMIAICVGFKGPKADLIDICEGFKGPNVRKRETQKIPRESPH